MSGTVKADLGEAPFIQQQPDYFGGDAENMELNGNGHATNGETESAEAAERRRFEQVDLFLDEKAADFYGMHVLAATDPARFRILDKAVWKAPQVDDETHQWRKGFEAVPSIDNGRNYMKKALSFTGPDGERQVIRAGEAFQRPEVAENVYSTLRALKDVPMHIIDFIRAWPDRQLEKPSPQVVATAEQALIKFLFSVHGPSIALHIQQYLQREATETAARLQNEVAVAVARAKVDQASTSSTAAG